MLSKRISKKNEKAVTTQKMLVKWRRDEFTLSTLDAQPTELIIFYTGEWKNVKTWRLMWQYFTYRSLVYR